MLLEKSDEKSYNCIIQEDNQSAPDKYQNEGLH